MERFEKIGADTTLDDRETRELIARLSGGSHQTRLHDIAEAMDVDIETAMKHLVEMRAEKVLNQPPVQSQKLASMLDDMKTPLTRRVTLDTTKRLVIGSVVIFVTMLASAGLFIQYIMVKSPKLKAEIARQSPPSDNHVFNLDDHNRRLTEKGSHGP